MKFSTPANGSSATSGNCAAAFACWPSTRCDWLYNLVVCVIAAFGVSASSSAFAAGPPAELLLPPTASDAARYAVSSRAPEPGVARQRPVGVNFQELDPSLGAAPAQIDVDLFDGQQVTVDLDRFENRASNNYTWYGHVRSHSGSHVILTVVSGQMAGSIVVGDTGNRAGGRYQINSTADGLHLLREINESAFPPDHPPGLGDPLAPSFGTKSLFSAPPKIGSALNDIPSKAADSGATIDVMVVYSNQTAAAVGSAIGAQIQQAIDTANTVYANSGITARLRLVNSVQVNYSESGDFPTDLNWLSSNSVVASLRDTYGADLVSMFVEGSQYCGYGWIGPSPSYAFSVVNRGCSSGNYSFPHELGHNFGARHDVYVDASTTPYAYGHGYVDCTEGWRDVMAYPSQCGGTRIPYFSNPNMTYGSPPDLLGLSSTADVARVHNQNAYAVANFRLSTGGGGGGGCSYALSPVSANVGTSAGSGSLTVTAGTGCAWTSTANASWLAVAAGSGTSGAGTLNYTFTANAGPARTGTIAIGGQTFTVNQGTGCTYALSPTSATASAGGGAGTTLLATGSGCTWTASSSASWLVVSASSGSGGATIAYSVSANTGAARSANLSIGGTTFVVTQAASASPTSAAATAALSPTSISFSNQPVGRTSSAQTATLSNSGGGTLTITSLIQGGANPGDFIMGGSCAVNVTLAGGQSCTLTYTFQASDIGSRTASLSVATSANAVTLSLAGTGKKTGRK